MSQAEPKCSQRATFFNMINCLVGSGVLTLASGFKDAGWLGGTIGVIVIWLINTRTIYLIVKCKRFIEQGGMQGSMHNGHDVNGSIRWTDSSLEEGGSDTPLLPNGQKRIKDYTQVGEAAFGKLGRYSLLISMCISQVGFCCAYLIFISTNISNNFWIEPGETHKWVVMACICPVIMGLVFLPNMRLLAPTSAFANLALITAIVIILTTPLINTDVKPSFDKVEPLKGFHSFPIFFGIACFAYTIHGVAITFETQMQEPKEFYKILYLVLGTVTIIYLMVGFCGYLYFGESTMGDITVNLKEKGVTTDLIKGVKICLMIGIGCTYPLQIMPVVQNLEGALLSRHSAGYAKYILRALVVLVTAVIANIVPFYGLFSSLVGALTTSFMAITMPPLCHLKLTWHRSTPTSRALDIAIVIFSFVAMGISTELALEDIIWCTNPDHKHDPTFNNTCA